MLGLLLVEVAQAVEEGTDDHCCENTHVEQLGGTGHVLDVDPQELHLVTLIHALLLLLLGLALLVPDLVLLVELLDEAGDAVLFLCGGHVVLDALVVQTVEQGEQGRGVELRTLDVELNGDRNTDCTSCWVISASQVSTPTAYNLLIYFC